MLRCGEAGKEKPRLVSGAFLPLAFVLRHFLPELRLKVQFVHGLDEAAYVVTKHLAQRFVNLRRAGLTPQSIPELESLLLPN